jgi:HSP20 family protein
VGRVYRSEFRYGTYRRSIALPPGATEDDVTATYLDGIVEVRVPMVDETSAAVRVPVTRA